MGKVQSKGSTDKPSFFLLIDTDVVRGSVDEWWMLALIFELPVRSVRSSHNVTDSVELI
jgi:hypothetical protein